MVQTDYHPLHLNKLKYINDRVMCWALSLQGLRMQIETIKGCDNNAADFLSRPLNDVDYMDQLGGEWCYVSGNVVWVIN